MITTVLFLKAILLVDSTRVCVQKRSDCRSTANNYARSAVQRALLSIDGWPMSTQLSDTPADSNLALLNRVFKEGQIILLRYFLKDSRTHDVSPQSLSAELWHLLNNCVVIAANASRLELGNNTHTRSSLHDIINRIIETTVRRGIKPRDRPIFTRGFYASAHSFTWAVELTHICLAWGVIYAH